MIVHLFNSSSISGPERLVIPALANERDHFAVINMVEDRIDRMRESDPLEDYVRSFHMEYHDVTVCGRWDLLAIRELRMLLERLNPDLVHAHDVKASVYLLQAQAGWHRRRFPIISTHHGIQGRPDWKTQIYERFYRRYILKQFDRALAVSTPDYEFLLRSTSYPQKVRLHLNGVNGLLVHHTHRFRESQAIRHRWFPQQAEMNAVFLFGVVGRLSAEKDHARILNVLAALKRKPVKQDWRCLIFGTGPLENELKQKAQELGLNQHVLWMGYRKEVGNELAGLDLLLSFSKAEGLPISFIEAGWAGTPVFCTRVGGAIDLIPDGRYGTTIPPDENTEESALRLQQILTIEGQSQLKAQGKTFQDYIAKEFTQTKWLERLQEVYGEVGVRWNASPSAVITKYDFDGTDNPGFLQRAQMMLMTRLQLYPTGQLETVRRWNRNAFRILMYHRFPLGTPGIQQALTRQCEHITRHYKVVSLTDIGRHLTEGFPLPPHALAITVDDGYRDFLINAYPVFHAFKIPATVFLTCGFLDHQWMWWDLLHYAISHTKHTSLEFRLFDQYPVERLSLATPHQRRSVSDRLIELLKDVPNPIRLQFIQDLPRLLDMDLPAAPPPPLAPLKWSEVRYLAAHGIEFGAHTNTHPILSRLQSEAELRNEIMISKERIEKELKRPVLHFCYPNGRREDVSPATIEILQQCQFQTAVTAEKGVNSSKAHPLWLRRIGVDPIMSNFNFQALLAGVGGSRSKHASLYALPKEVSA